MLDFPSNPVEGDVHRDVSSGQSWVWTSDAWVYTSAVAAEQVIVEDDSGVGYFVAGDTLFQFGSATTASSGKLTVTYPIAFDNTPDVVTTNVNGSDAISHDKIATINSTSFDAYTYNSTGTLAAVSFRWIAVGLAPLAMRKPKSVFGGVAEAASGGASITIGDTFPSGPAEGALHYLTQNPTGLFVWIDDGTSQQWVMANGSSPEQVKTQIVDDGAGHMVVGNTLYQWGQATSNGSGFATITFPIAFAAVPFVGGNPTTSTGQGATIVYNPPTTTSAEAATINTGGGYRTNYDFNWLAMGEAPDELKQPSVVTGGAGSLEPVQIVDEDVASGWTVVGKTLIQWGSATGDSNGQSSVNFQKVFGGTPYVAVTPRNVGSPALSSTYTAYVRSADTTGCSLGGTTGTFGAFGVGWIAIGPALEEDQQPTVLSLNGGGTDREAFHDPTNVGSWRIDKVTNTLECWGWYAGGDAGVTTFPRTFIRPPVITTSANPPTSNLHVHTVLENSATTTQFTWRNRWINNSNNGASTEPSYWHAIGEWDGN